MMDNKKYCCEICGAEKNIDTEIEWITHHYGVCKDCYENLCPEEINQIIEDFG